MEQQPTMPDKVTGTVDTPRTSNLKFLRAKRLSYFSGKSSQSLVYSAEKTPRSHKDHQPTRSQTPRRCLSAPVLKQKQTSTKCDIQKSDNALTQTPHEEAILQPVEAKTAVSTTYELQETESANKSTAELTVQQHLPPVPREVEPNSYNLQTTSKKSVSESFISHGAQQGLDELMLEKRPDNQYTALQTTSKETNNTPLSQHNVQPDQENERGKVIGTQDFQQKCKEMSIMISPSYYPILEKAKTKVPLIHSHLKSEPEMETDGHSTYHSLQSQLKSEPEVETDAQSTHHSHLKPEPEVETNRHATHHSLQSQLKLEPEVKNHGHSTYPKPHSHLKLEPEVKNHGHSTHRSPHSHLKSEPEVEMNAHATHFTVHNHFTLEPEVETTRLSTYRSLLRSSFAFDLDKGLLDDISVPESEKLQHVMTWAKKFLNKCNAGDELLFSDAGDGLQCNLDKKNAFQSVDRTVDRSIEVNDIPRDSTLKNDLELESENCNMKKQALTNHSMKESKQSRMSKSPRNLLKIKSDFTNVSRTKEMTHVFSPKLRTSNYSDRAVSPPSESDHKDYKYIKHLNSKSYDNLLNEFEFRGKDCSDDEDSFGNQWNYSMGSRGIVESNDKAKHTFVIKEDDTSSSESSLDTERLNTLLENLETHQKVTEQKTHVLKKDGSSTDRTFLVKKDSGTGDDTVIYVSNNALGRIHSSSNRTYKEMNLFEDLTPRTYRVCTVCNFCNTTKTSWCEECGSVLGNDRGPKSDTTNDLPRPLTAHEQLLDDVLRFNDGTFEGLDKMPTVNQMDTAGKTEVCWEDNSDVVSDSDGSVLEKYFHYVKQLDMIKVQNMEKQSKSFQADHSCEISSEDESCEEVPKPQISSGIYNYYPTKTDSTSDGDEGGIEFLQANSHSVKPYTSHFDQPQRSNRQFRGSNENNYETVSKLKNSIDRKQQNTPQKSSKGTGPKRYWEKSSIAWSSYTHGELRPRSQHSNQRPSSAETKRKNNQWQNGKASGLDYGMSSKMTEHVERKNTTSLTKADEYKSVAAAYMRTVNAWVVTEHLCKDNSDGSSCRLQWAPDGDHDSMWLLLPDELLINIFANLLHKDLANVAQVCRRFRYIANDDSLWKVIKITNCHSLSDNCLVSIGLHHPETLSLYRCHDESQNITEEGLGKLFQHCKTSLMELNITNCSGLRFEGDAVLSHASAYCIQLTSVDISWTGATDKGIVALVEGCARLKNLSMNGCKITDHAITALLQKHSKSLVKVEVFGCHALTAKSLISITTECSHLENLNIGRIPKVTDVCLTKIASNLHKINTLNLTGLNVVRDRAVHYIVKQCPKLENITLSSCSQVTDISLVEISTYLRTITYLDVSGCKKISDIGIQALARSCQQIRYLDLSSTGTGKRGVCLLASYCNNSLECLKLSFCKEVTSDAIEKLCKNCKRLKILHLYGCRISPDFEHIKQFSKSFQIFHDLSIATANISGE
ncbi:uncharacterized protein [Aquarana catesbeiana]|uniref:uncharacterized protein n=1 Tax=Aquarana catesbeiana TaxID=8400 RepID=UPI003CC9A379